MPAYKLLVEFEDADELQQMATQLPSLMGKAKSAMKKEPTQDEVDNDDDAPPVLKTPAKRGRKPAADKVEPAVTGTAGQPAATELAIPYKDVQDATMKFHGDHGRDTTLALLAEFKVKKATDLKPEQYKDYLARLNARIEELKAEGDLA